MLVRVDGALAARRHRQGPGAGGHRQDRHGRRHRSGDRVRRLDDPRAVDGRPHDGLQHGDRGRRARRHGRGRRDARSTTSRAGRSRRPARSGTRRWRYWRTLHSDEGAKFDAVVELDAAAIRAAGQLGHVARDGRPRRWTRPGSERKESDPVRARRHRARAGLHGPRGRTCRSTIDRASTRSSSARAPTRASRTCATAAVVVRGSMCAGNVKLAMVVPGSGLVKTQAEAEGLDRSSWTPASNGASRVARCAWR